VQTNISEPLGPAKLVRPPAKSRFLIGKGNLFCRTGEAIYLNPQVQRVKLPAKPVAPGLNQNTKHQSAIMGQSMSNETKCVCQHCEGGIKFASENAGESIVCPHCGKETLLPAMKYFVWQEEQPDGPFDEVAMQNRILEGLITDDTLVCIDNGELDWVPAKELFFQDSPPENSATEDSADDDSLLEIVVNDHNSFFYRPTEDGDFFVVLRLNSGTDLKVKAIRLYDELSLRMMHLKRAEVLKKYPGMATGSLGWWLVTTAGGESGEGGVSTAAARAGDNLVAEAMQLEQKVRENVHFLPVGVIENIENPLPGFWRVSGKSKIRIPPQEKADWIASAFIHNGDDFVMVQTIDDMVYSIRWNAVECYACQTELEASDESGSPELDPRD